MCIDDIFLANWHIWQMTGGHHLMFIAVQGDPEKVLLFIFGCIIQKVPKVFSFCKIFYKLHIIGYHCGLETWMKP